MYGSLNLPNHDGIQMVGSSGSRVYTNSLISILKHADLTPSSSQLRNQEPEYDPLKIFRQRIISSRENPPKVDAPSMPQKLGPSRSTPPSSSSTTASSGTSSKSSPVTSRPSVIHSHRSEQLHSIPVSNFFDILGNC